jgi:hypothetical protein
MSWLTQLFGGGGEDPLAVSQRQQMALADEQKRQEIEQNRQADAARQQQILQQQELARQQDADRQAATLEQQRYDAEMADRTATRATADKQYQDQLDIFKKSLEPTPQEQEQMTAQQKADEAERQLKEYRNTALGRVNAEFQPEFERSLVPDTYDDPYIAEAYGQQAGKADEYLNNLLKRKVITDAGYKGGLANKEEQGAGVRTELGGLSEAMLEAQRGKLTGVADRARSAASGLQLGQTLDPSIYSNEISQLGTDFGAEGRCSTGSTEPRIRSRGCGWLWYTCNRRDRPTEAEGATTDSSVLICVTHTRT